MWEELATKIAVDGFSDCVKNTFAKHENVLQSLENEFMKEENNSFIQTTDSKNCLFTESLKDIYNFIHPKDTSNSIIYKHPFDYTEILSDIMKQIDTFDVSLEELMMIKLPKDIRYSTKDTQTDNPKQNPNISICNVGESVDIVKIPSNNSLLLESKRKVEIIVNESLNKMYYPKHTRKEEQKNMSMDLSNHLNEVAKNIAKEFKMPMKYRNKAKHKFNTNI